MNNGTKPEWDLSFCGLNCAVCEIYLASHGDNELHDGLVKFFQENVDSNITSVSCEKCRVMTDKCWTPDCHFRTCAIEQGLTYCFECKDFVCEKLAEFGKQAPPNHANIIENLKKMKELGVEEWIASQREVKFCP
ncbi:MAG: DUF3795 domain-containing protein [Candidatus Hodarchaeota archaeon]